MNPKIVSGFVSLLGSARVREEEPMSAHTTFKTGGPAELMLLPRTEEELLWVLRFLRRESVPCVVVGRGSNLLVSDEGIRGAVVKLTDGFDAVTIEGETVRVQAGATLRTLCMEAIHAGLTGLEFAGGIPGCVGGGIMMNAGAYGGELKDCAQWVRVLTKNLKPRKLSAEEMAFGYRTSAAQEKGYIILEAGFRLQPGDADECMDRMNEMNARRREKQPLTSPSAGSTFKRPKGHYAGALIEQCGLKGFTIGGAQVSEKHAGFIINLGNADSRDIYELICYVQKKVLEGTGVLLEPEVKLLGEF